jgi:hypothetical protein
MKRSCDDIWKTASGPGRYAVDDPKVATRAIIAMLTGIPTWYRPGGGLSKQDIETLYLTMVRKCVARKRSKPTGDRMT